MTGVEKRKIAWWWVFPIVIGVYGLTVLILLFLPRATDADIVGDGGFYQTTHGLLWGGIVPAAVSLLLTVIVISALGIWPRVWRDSVPTRRWVLALPFLVVAPALAFADYGALTANGGGFFALVVLLVLTIGVSEELMYRGLVLELVRNGPGEFWAAGLSTLLFAFVHFINGGGALPTVINAFVGGYLYYLTRRATVFIVFPALAHASFDLFGYSHWESTGDASFNMFVYHVVLFIVTAALWKLLSPRHPDPGTRRENTILG